MVLQFETTDIICRRELSGDEWKSELLNDLLLWMVSRHFLGSVSHCTMIWEGFSLLLICHQTVHILFAIQLLGFSEDSNSGNLVFIRKKQFVQWLCFCFRMSFHYWAAADMTPAAQCPSECSAALRKRGLSFSTELHIINVAVALRCWRWPLKCPLKKTLGASWTDCLLRFYSCANSSIKFYCQGRAPKGRGKTGGKWGPVMLEACPKDVLLEERRRRKEEEKRRKREEKAVGDSASWVLENLTLAGFKEAMLLSW